MTKVLVNRFPGRQVAGAGQTGCRCRADRLQVPGRQVAGAGEDKLQVPGRQVAGAGQTGRPSGPVKAGLGLVVQVRQSQRSREGRPISPG